MRTEHVGERWTEILDCTAHVLSSRSLESTRLADVAERLGVRQQALYHYVSSKDELFFRVLARAMDEALEGLAAADEVPAGLPRLRRLLEIHVRLIASQPALFRLFYGNVESLPDDLRGQLRERERRYVERFEAETVATIDAGGLPDVDPYIASATLLGMATWTYRWMRAEDRSDPGPVVEQMLRLVAFREEER